MNADLESTEPGGTENTAAGQKTGTSSRTKRPIDIFRERQGERTPEQKEFYKEQTQLRKLLMDSLREKAYTIPELAVRCQRPAEIVFWNVMAMRRYGKVVEQEKRGDYYCYRLKEV